MNEGQLKRTLQSVGMQCFVDYFDIFSSDRHSKEDIIEYLFEENDFTEKSCKSRTNHAKRIFKESRQIDALKLIESSKRMKLYTKLQASKLRTKLTHPRFNINEIPIITKLKNFVAKDPKCQKVYCSTCGGLSSSISKNMDQKQVVEIKGFLASKSNDELYLLGEWYDFLIKYK